MVDKKKYIFAATLVAIVACTPGQLGTPEGQLLCAIQKGATPIIVPVATTAINDPLGKAVAVIVTGEVSAWVQAQCDAAAVAVGGSAGIPVAPPAAGKIVAAQVVIPPGVAKQLKKK